MPGLAADLRAARLFAKMLKPNHTQPLARRLSCGEAEYDLYDYPAARQTILLVYGLALAGEADPRLVHLARSLVASGVRVIVPILAGLKEYRFSPRDLETLLTVAGCARANNLSPLAVMAVSAGGSLSLLAAATPAGSELFGALVLLSPLYNLETVWHAFHRPQTPPPAGTQAWDDYVWTQCVIAYRNREWLALPSETLARLEQVLRRYSVDLPTPEKVAFYTECLQPLELPGWAGLLHEGAALEQLSPRGKLAGLSQRVALLYSRTDALSPAEEMHSLYTELAQRHQGQTWLLQTPLLAHANLGSLAHLGDAFSLIHLLGKLFQ